MLTMVNRHDIMEFGADAFLEAQPWADALQARALDHRTDPAVLAWMANPTGLAPAPIEGAEKLEEHHGAGYITGHVAYYLAANPSLPDFARAEWLANPTRSNGLSGRFLDAIQEEAVGRITAATTGANHALWAALYPEAVAGNPLAPREVLEDLMLATGPAYVWGRAAFTLGLPWPKRDGSDGVGPDPEVYGRPRATPERLAEIARAYPRLRCSIAIRSDAPTATLEWLAEDRSLDVLNPRGERIGDLTRERARESLACQRRLA